MKKMVLKGYLYPCGSVECQGIILYPKRITLEDFEQAIKYWKESKLPTSIEKEVKRITERLKRNELYCGLISPCSKDKDHGLGSEAIELVELLEKFKGKKVKITIETEE